MIYLIHGLESEGDVMKRNKKSKKKYEIVLEADGISWGIILVSIVILAWSLVYLYILIDSRANSFAISVHKTVHFLLAIISFIALCLQFRRRRRKGKRIWVNGDSFKVGRPGEEGRVYRFADISQVKMVPTMRPTGRGGMTSGPYCWQIYIGKKQVAVLFMSMENAWRFIQRTDEMGFNRTY